MKISKLFLLVVLGVVPAMMYGATDDANSIDDQDYMTLDADNSDASADADYSDAEGDYSSMAGAYSDDSSMQNGDDMSLNDLGDAAYGSYVSDAKTMSDRADQDLDVADVNTSNDMSTASEDMYGGMQDVDASGDEAQDSDTSGAGVSDDTSDIDAE